MRISDWSSDVCSSDLLSDALCSRYERFSLANTDMHLLDRSSKRKNISTATVVLEGSSQIPLASPRSRGLASAAIARSRSPDSSRTQAITDNETRVMMAELRKAFRDFGGGMERRPAPVGCRRAEGRPWR